MKNKDTIAVDRVQMKNVPESFKCERNHHVKRLNFTFFSQSEKSVQRQKIFGKNSTAPK